MAETLYLFDGYNLLHAGGFAEPQALVDRLAGFVAVRGARGVVVFDGEGADATYGALEVRYAKTADHLLERLAAEHRDAEGGDPGLHDRAIRDTAGLDVRKVFSRGLRSRAADQPERRAPEGRRRPGRGCARGRDAPRLEEWRRGRP